jgi:glycosyltransferase involved in cell wall biosynthesis
MLDIMPKSLTLTIVIPAFNEEGHIGACLDAIAAQTASPDEVIVVDNNSIDATKQIANQYQFVKVKQERRQGVVFARNKGFDTATGRIIARIDADTVLPPDWVARAKEIYQGAGRPQYFAVTGPSRFRNRFSRGWYALHRLTYFWPGRLLLGHNTLVGSNMFMTNKLWRRVRQSVCLDTGLHEDMDLAHHIEMAGIKVHFLRHFKASILGRKMLSRVYTYPKMMLKARTVHKPTFETVNI